MFILYDCKTFKKKFPVPFWFLARINCNLPYNSYNVSFLLPRVVKHIDGVAPPITVVSNVMQNVAEFVEKVSFGIFLNKDSFRIKNCGL